MQNEWGQVRGCRDPFEPLSYFLREFIKKFISIQNSSTGIDVERCCGVVAVALAISLREGLWMSLEDQVPSASWLFWSVLEPPNFRKTKKKKEKEITRTRWLCAAPEASLERPWKLEDIQSGSYHYDVHLASRDLPATQSQGDCYHSDTSQASRSSQTKTASGGSN